MPVIDLPSRDTFRQYVGIDFVHGDTDCYGLVRRVYSEVFGITLTNYARPDFWWDHPEEFNLYMDNVENEGFRQVPSDLMRTWEVGDLIFMAIQSSVPCHAAIYIGNGEILHHFYGRKSAIDTYCKLWKNTTTGVFRHKDLKINKPTVRMDLSQDERIRAFILLQQERSRKGRTDNDLGNS
jgi:cell wall-associated NlpC family hydrolase